METPKSINSSGEKVEKVVIQQRKNFMQQPFDHETGMKKREEFAISLRKQKTK
jgi:hypothetical protein